MGGSQKPPRLVVTWAVLIPLLLVITFVLSPGLIVSVFAAAIISPVVHSAVGGFYRKRQLSRGRTASRLFGGQ